MPTEQFMPQAEVARLPKRAGEPLSILTVGRLVHQKFHECLIRAVATVPANLTIIGDGIERSRLEQLAIDLGMASRVKFIPAVPNADIAEQYRAADIFAIATHYEGFCIPVLEAMACGLPVVASDIGPIREIVGDCGLLVSNKPDAFSAALRTLASDPELRQRLGVRARERSLKMNGAMMEKCEADLYKGLLPQR